MLSQILSILHIADLHKKAEDSFDNLLSSIEEDCESYSSNGITKPNVIVVSGDLIRGGKPEEITTQYQETKDFLEKLTDYFLNGDKSRIVIVPGNHDVDWNVSATSMESYPMPQQTLSATMTESEDQKYYQEYEKAKTAYNKTKDLFLRGELQEYRWDWKRLELKRISKTDEYNNRFNQFATFYHDFYGDDYPMEPSKQVKLFDIKEYGVCFVGFNSCYQNDHLNRSGKIYPACIVEAKRQIKELVNQERVFIGVWHHNVKGLPHVDNYLDYQVLNSLLGMDIKLALHGHQHYSGVVEEYKDVYDENERMLLFSTGSLYGSASLLAYGTPRQYNIIELDQIGTTLNIKVHLRQDNNTEEYDMPSWGDGIIKGVSKSHWSTSIILPMKQDNESQLSKIVEEGMRTGDYGTAITKLKELSPILPEVRGFIISFMMKNKDYKGVVDTIKVPQTSSEAIDLIQAATKLKDPEIKAAVKAMKEIKESTDPNVIRYRAYL